MLDHNKKQSLLNLDIKKLGINGEGIAYYKKRAIFIPGALPKEKVLVKITKKFPKYWEGQLIKIIKKSPFRVKPLCSIYEQCGGCQLQHLQYKKQCEYKEDIIKQSLKKFKPLGYEEYKFKKSIDMENPWYYRNKLQFQARYNNKTNSTELGLYKLNSHKLIPINNCQVQDPVTQEIANTVCDLLNKFNLSIYNEKKHTGWFRTLMVRSGRKTTECQVVLITTNKDFPSKQLFINELIKKHPTIVSIMQNINNEKTSIIFGKKTIKIYGKESIEEKLDNVTFDLSAEAFFQLNPIQTEKLYQSVHNALNLNTQDIIIDAYCGVGTIGLSLAHQVKKVIGVDIIPKSIEDACFNAKRMNLNNTQYLVGDAAKLIPKWLHEYNPTGIILDPPRTGLGDKLCATLVSNPIPKMVYVSCNPSTLAKDLTILTKAYNVNWLQSVDMFPQTARVEVIVSLEKK